MTVYHTGIMNASLQYIPILIMSFATALGLTPVSRQVAMRIGLVDKPNLPRKTHKDHKPMMGGLAIFISMILPALIFSPESYLRELGMVLTGASLLVLIGGLDDRYNLRWQLRFGIQFLAAIILVLAGIRIRLFGFFWLDIPATLLWVVALTNATNFLDNMDGLTAGLSAIAATWFLVIALVQDQIFVSLLSAAILGSTIGFLTYNFAPASTFMGDMGALPLGYLLATLAIKLNFANQPLSTSWMIPILVLVLPIFDINLVVWTRLSEGRSPVQAGRDHTSHRIQSVGFSARKTLFILYGMCGLFGSIAFLMSVSPRPQAFQLGILGILVMGFLFILMIWIRRHYQREAAVT